MAKIEKEVQKFIKNYQNAKGVFFKVIIPDGCGGQIRKQGFLTLKDATDFAVKKYFYVLSSNKSIVSQNSSLLFRQYGDEWFAHKLRNGLEPSSAERYETILRKYLKPFFGHIKMKDLEKHHLRSYIKELQSDGVPSSAISYSATVFKSIMKQAEIEDVVGPTGIRTVPTPRHKNKDPRFWDAKQMGFFLNAAKGHKHYELWKFTLYTGLRAGEVAALQWDAVHLDKKFNNGLEGYIEVRRTYDQKTLQVKETTKNGDKRIIPLLPEAREVLETLKANENFGFVFGDGTKPLDSSHFNRQLQTALKKMPIQMISFHGLRHSFCSYLDSTGMSRRIVSEIIGHRDLNTTNRYSHVSNQMLGTEVSLWLEKQSKQNSNKLEAVNF